MWRNPYFLFVRCIAGLAFVIERLVVNALIG